MTIKIILEDDLGSLIAKRETSNWKVAEMNLESLREWWNMNGFRKKPRETLEVMSPKDEDSNY